MPDQVGVFNVPSFRDPYQGSNINVQDPFGGGGPQQDVNVTLPPWVNPITRGHTPWTEPCAPGYYRPCTTCPCEVYEPGHPVDPATTGLTSDIPFGPTHPPGTIFPTPTAPIGTTMGRPVRAGGLDPIISGASNRGRGGTATRDLFGTFERQGGGAGGGSQRDIASYENPMLTMGSPLLGKNVIAFKHGGKIHDSYNYGGKVPRYQYGGATHTMPDGTVHPGATHEDYMAMMNKSSEYEDGGKLTASEQKILKKAEKKGRKGDSILAHINPQEAAMLKAMGGSGMINPYTGQVEYGWNPIDTISNTISTVAGGFTKGLAALFDPNYGWDDYADDIENIWNPSHESYAERLQRESDEAAAARGLPGRRHVIRDGVIYEINPEGYMEAVTPTYGGAESEFHGQKYYYGPDVEERETGTRSAIGGIEEKATAKKPRKTAKVVDPFSNIKDYGKKQETLATGKYRWDLENPLIRENVDIFRGGGKMNYYAGGGRNPYKYDNGGMLGGPTEDVPFSIAGKKFPAMMSTERDSFVHSSDLSDYGQTPQSPWADRMNNMMMQNTKQEIQNTIGKIMNTAVAGMQLNSVANLGQKIKQKKFNQGGRF